MGKDAEVPLVGDAKDPKRVAKFGRKLAMIINSLIRGGYILRSTGTTDTSGDVFTIPGLTGGTVTSVALTEPTEFVVAGSPVTGAGTLAVTKATQTANFVWAGPTTGAGAQPTFRALVSADLPSGIGTVTSVGQTVPTEFVIAGSPVTGSGTLAITKANQANNSVWASPANGASGQPTFRPLVAADIPIVDPLTTKGDLFTFSNSPTRLPVGNDTWVLAANSGQACGLQWEAPPSGNVPVTTKGDLFGFSNAAARIPVGTDTFVLTANSSAALGVDWEAPSGGNGTGNDPITSIYPLFTPTGSDDEFSAGTFPTGWTAVNSGSHLPVATNTNNILSLLLPGGDASGELHAWAKSPTITNGSYIECGFRGFGFSQNFNLAALFFSNGTTYGSGAQIVWFFSYNQGVLTLSSWTGFNTQTNIVSANFQGNFLTADIFLRLQMTAANTWHGFASPDGISWVDMTGARTSTLTPTSAGFAVSTYGGANPFVSSFRYCKFR